MKQAIAALTMLCAASLATAGDVAYVTIPGPELVSVPTPMQAWRLDNAPKDAGTVWAKATIGKIMLPGTNKPSAIQVAIDTDTADATDAYVVRFNFDGKAQFSKELSLPLKVTAKQPNLWMGTFGPKVIDVKHGNKIVPVWVQGNVTCGVYLERPPGTKPGVKIKPEDCKKLPYNSITLTAISAIQADVKFGDKIYPVRLADASGNFTYNRPAKIVKGGAMPFLTSGDGMAIDTGDGKFGKDAQKCLVGQPVRVDGKWYKVAVSDDAAKITAEPLDAPMATIKVDSDQWNCRLISKDTVLDLRGGKDAIEVPAGEYFIQTYTVTGPTSAAAQGQTPAIVGTGVSAENYQNQPVNLEVGKTADFPIGTPLKASVKSAVNGNNVVFALVFTDSGGHRTTSVTGNNGRPPAPKFSVVDSGGKSVFESTLEYG